MTDDLHYKLEISISRGSSIENIEEKLEDVLLDLYDLDSVEAIKVVDKTPPIDEDMDKLLDIIHDVESEDIRCAIESVKKLENSNE